MSGSLRGRAAIVGIGNTRRWDAPGRSGYDQLFEAAILALEDCGLRLHDVDGLFCGVSGAALPVLNVAERLGAPVRVFDGTMAGGSSFLFHVQSAATALDAGLCDVALIAYGSNQRSAGGKLASLPDPQLYEEPFRPLYPISSYALAAARHMHLYGTRREDLAEIALAARAWAALNPDAFLRDPLTRDEVLASRLVSDPLSRADCCLVTDGGGAVVMTRADRAGDLRAEPIYVLGTGTAVSHRQISAMPDAATTAAVISGARAYEMARLGPADVDHLMVYDAFTFTTLVFLEDLGFCPKGEGARFVQEGGVAPGGRLAVNTNGGGLSCNHPGMYGIFTLIEAVLQLRGAAGARQVRGAETALAHANGGVLSSQATTILGRASAL